MALLSRSSDAMTVSSPFCRPPEENLPICCALLGGLANEARGHPGRASPIARAGDIAGTLRAASYSLAVPSACLVWAALGPQPGRERPECLGQPRGTPGIICPAQHPFPA
jgi:hypothetical protein